MLRTVPCEKSNSFWYPATAWSATSRVSSVLLESACSTVLATACSSSCWRCRKPLLKILPLILWICAGGMCHFLLTPSLVLSLLTIV